MLQIFFHSIYAEFKLLLCLRVALKFILHIIVYILILRLHGL